MKTNAPAKNLLESPTLPVALWLLKDACWVMGFHFAAMLMIVPTLAVAIFMAWNSKKSSTQLFHNVALCYWIAANAMWMTGAFFQNDALLPYAMVLFVAGMIVVAAYYALIYPRNQKSVQQTQTTIHRTMMEQVRKVA